LNIGDYADVGGTYPSLSKTLEILPESIVLRIKYGVYPNSSNETFNQLLTLIPDGEGEICIREFGLGLNEGIDLFYILLNRINISFRYG